MNRSRFFGIKKHRRVLMHLFLAFVLAGVFGLLTLTLRKGFDCEHTEGFSISSCSPAQERD